jgi:hypothetical protein
VPGSAEKAAHEREGQGRGRCLLTRRSDLARRLPRPDPAQQDLAGPNDNPNFQYHEHARFRRRNVRSSYLEHLAQARAKLSAGFRAIFRRFHHAGAGFFAKGGPEVMSTCRPFRTPGTERTPWTRPRPTIAAAPCPGARCLGRHVRLGDRAKMLIRHDVTGWEPIADQAAARGPPAPQVTCQT